MIQHYQDEREKKEKKVVILSKQRIVTIMVLLVVVAVELRKARVLLMKKMVDQIFMLKLKHYVNS